MPYLHLDSWFAVQVVRQHETQVALLLASKGYEEFLPTYHVRRRWSDRVKIIEKPLFPGYVFCRMSENPTGLVCTTPGVIRVVGIAGKPSPIPNHEIRAVQRIINSKLNAAPFMHFIRAGQQIQVKQGPLAGLAGILVRHKGENRLVISVELTMRSISVELDTLDIDILAAIHA